MDGAGYVRVLAVLKKQKHQEWVADLARSLVSNEPPRAISSEEAGLPAEFVLDPSFYAVALGPYTPDTINLADERISSDLSILLP